MNAVLERLLSTQTVIDDQGVSRPLVVHVPTGEGEFLQSVIRQIKPVTSFEVGLAYGVSSLFICEALAECGGKKHIVCDPDQFGGIGAGFYGVGLKNLRDAGFSELIEFHPVSSHILLPTLEQQGTRIQFAFVDGWHTFDYTLVEFFYIDHLLDVGGVIVFDDTLCYPAIRKALRYILSHRAYSYYGGEKRQPTRKRRALERVCNLPGLKSIARAEMRIPDYRLGLNGQFVAIRKERNDTLGADARRWDQHFDF